MMRVKKDWNFDIDNSYKNIYIIVLIMGISIVGVGSFLSKDFKLLSSGIYNNIFRGIVMVSFLYPLFTLKNIIPQIGIKKPYLSINNIPLTKREIFIDKIKSKIIPMIICVIAMIILNALVQVSTVDSTLSDGVILNMQYTLDAFLMGLIIFFQYFVGTILHLVKKIKGLKVIFIIIGSNIVLFIPFILMDKIFRNTGLLLMIGGGTFFILSMIAFIVCWKDFEKVCN